MYVWFEGDLSKTQSRRCGSWWCTLSSVHKMLTCQWWQCSLKFIHVFSYFGLYKISIRKPGNERYSCDCEGSILHVLWTSSIDSASIIHTYGPIRILVTCSTWKNTHLPYTPPTSCFSVLDSLVVCKTEASDWIGWYTHKSKFFKWWDSVIAWMHTNLLSSLLTGCWDHL